MTADSLVAEKAAADDEDVSVIEDLDTFDPETGILTLEDASEEAGHPVVVHVNRLKVREFFALLRIITRGAMHLLPTLDWKADQDDFVGTLLGMVVWAVPETPNESIMFLRLITSPVFPDRIAPASEEADKMRTDLWALLENPGLDDMLGIFEVVVRQEAEDIQSLGKRLRRWMALAKKTGQLKSVRSETDTESTSPLPGKSSNGSAPTAAEQPSLDELVAVAESSPPTS